MARMAMVTGMVLMGLSAGCSIYDDLPVGLPYPIVRMEALRQLRQSYDSRDGATAQPFGTWHDDVIGLLGEPTSESTERLYYSFCADRDCSETIGLGITLRREVGLCWMESGSAVEPSRFVARIVPSGMSFLPEWDPEGRPSVERGCGECAMQPDAVRTCEVAK